MQIRTKQIRTKQGITVQLLVQNNNIYHDFGSQKMEWRYFHKQNQIYYCLKFNLISFTAKSNFSMIHCNLT